MGVAGDLVFGIDGSVQGNPIEGRHQSLGALFDLLCIEIGADLGQSGSKSLHPALMVAEDPAPQSRVHPTGHGNPDVDPGEIVLFDDETDIGIDQFVESVGSGVFRVGIHRVDRGPNCGEDRLLFRLEQVVEAPGKDPGPIADGLDRGSLEPFLGDLVRIAL